ncbi:hypothetical protein [Paenibacillus koleovorans]|uniref:hypothetical protein n=1 Tax=Paenibacillus koleovorans TaxID=121608 RepID=UPI000FD82F63|nr:hypothetical protein [Paenibacillus koleovorans]
MNHRFRNVLAGSLSAENRRKTIIPIASLVVLTLFGTSISNADYGTAHIKIGSNTNGPGFQYWLDSSVSANGYTDTVANAATNWSAVSNSTANLWQITDASLAQIKVYVGSLGSGVFGETSYWNRSGSSLTNVAVSSITSGTNYDVARIVLDATNMSGWTWEERCMNTGHEIGHALGLSHFETYPAHSGDHWMKSGQFSLSSPTSTDADHLAYKW